jgi:uncharacterized protein (DUF1684 family)
MKGPTMKFAACLLLTVLALPACASDAGYVSEIDEWHAGRIERLKQPGSWLTLIGLIALPEGRSSFGTGEDADLRVDADVSAHIGDVIVESSEVRFVAVAAVTHDGDPVDEIRLAADVSGDPTILEVGSVSFYLIIRHERPYLRVKDSAAPLLSGFQGIDRWPVDEEWRVEAQWVEYDTPQVRQFPDVLGVAAEAEVSGEARFTMGGNEYTLYPNSIGDDWMYFVYGDATNGMESYGAGRFLYTDLPDADGKLVIDFNRSYNPPCVFTPFATCPLPADDNVLELEVTAGEKMFGDMH